MAIGQTFEKIESEAFKEKVAFTDKERHEQLRELDSLYERLEQNAGYSITDTTWQLFSRAIGITAAIAGNTSIGTFLSSIEKGSDGISKFIQSVNAKDKHKIDAKLHILRECMEDTKHRRSALEQAIQDLNRLVREIQSAQHEAKKSIIRK